MKNKRKLQEINQDNLFGLPQDEWQEENIRLRAGPGSGYDKYRHLTHKTGYGTDSGRRKVSSERPLNLRREIIGQNYNPVFIDTTLDRRYDFGSRYERNGLGAREFLNRFLDTPAMFIDEVADYLDLDVEKSFRITCAVLQSVRDRVDPRFAVFFGQALPLVLQGMYFSHYNLSRVPVVIREKNKFINFIQSKIPGLMREEFHDPREVIMGLRAVFHVLEKYTTQAAMNEMKRLLLTEITELIDSPRYDYNLTKHIMV